MGSTRWGGRCGRRRGAAAAPTSTASCGRCGRATPSHLTDNAGFTGVSRAAGGAEEFGGVANTAWEKGPFYRVRLRDFAPLDPPLTRETFFAAPYSDRLVALIDAGARNLFYNREPSFNQGAYLTPAPPELLAILNDAYHAVAGRYLPLESGGGGTVKRRYWKISPGEARVFAATWAPTGVPAMG